MSPSRLRKRINRLLMVSWREQPTRYDIEALQANIRRVGLVIQVRWALITVLVLYSVVGGALYNTRLPVAELAGLMWVPAVALSFVVLYNTFYTLNYRRLGSIAVWNHIALILDVLVVTVLVYFSGGVNSWFWSMYSLFILEAAFILPRSRDAWLLALGCMVVLGLLEWFEFVRLIPHTAIPFAAGRFHLDPVFVSVRYLWQVTVLAGTASVANLLVGEFRRELASRTSQTIVDLTTGLYSRGYFMRALPSELNRAERDHRPFHLLLLDLDHFGAFNDRFGLDAGDQLLKLVADAITETAALAGDRLTTTNVVARIGGEEFAVLLSEDSRLDVAPRLEDALACAEQLRVAIEGVKLDGAGVTVSLGVASWPDDGGTSDELLDAADAALACAIDDGGNRVISASRCALVSARAASAAAER